MGKPCKFCGNKFAMIHIRNSEMMCLRCSMEGKDMQEEKTERKKKIILAEGQLRFKE